MADTVSLIILFLVGEQGRVILRKAFRQKEYETNESNGMTPK